METDTRMGSSGGRFPQTSGTALRNAGSDDTATRRIAQEHLVAAYWKPVYKYIQIRWRASSDDAEDLTQGFFARALGNGFFTSYDPGKAAFRTFLRVCVDRFVSNQKAKRGTPPTALTEEPAMSADPEAFFHREWIRQVFTLAVADLREEYVRRGRQAAFRAFELYDLAEEDRPSYAEIGALLEAPITQVTNYLAAARRDLRRAVLHHLRRLTATETEFRAEARALLGRRM
jgi:RNA polymerase sigma factor (sigma-70 family)